jgi:hypothetical protein
MKRQELAHLRHHTRVQRCPLWSPKQTRKCSEPASSKMIDRDLTCVGGMITSSHQLQPPIAAPGHCSQAKFV